MNRLKAGWPKGKKKSSKGTGAAPSSLAAYGPGAPPLQFQRSSQSLPPLIEDCLAWLEAHRVWEVEGIFRISGDFHEIKALLRKYAKGKKVKLDEETTGLRAHTVACLFKTYLRELPIPLLTFELYKPFLSAIGVPDEKARLELIRTTMAMLPPANKVLLARLLTLMRKVADHADTNKMHAQNLAIVFAPCLLRPENDDLMAALMDGGVSQALLSTMVTHYSYFFIEKSDKSETTKQLTGEYKDFYKTLRKGTLRLAASMVEEKKLLQRLKAGDEYQSEGEETGMEIDDGTGGGENGQVSEAEAGLASMSSEVRRFAAKAEPRRRAATTAVGEPQAKPLPAPPRPSRPPPTTKLLPPSPQEPRRDPPAIPLRPQPPAPQESTRAEQPTQEHSSQEREEARTIREGEDVHHKTMTAATEAKTQVDLKKTRKPSVKRTNTNDGDGDVGREEKEKEKETARKNKQISMSWNPTHMRRELGAIEGEERLRVELEGSGKELLRSHSTNIASIRRRLKQSSAELASSDSDSSSSSDDDSRSRSLCRSTPAASAASAVSDSDSDQSPPRRLSMSQRAKSIRSRIRSDSDSDSSTEDSSSDESKQKTTKTTHNRKHDSDDDSDDDSDSDSDTDQDTVKVVTKTQTTTYLTPEQMVKLVRQQRAQQRKELLAKKKTEKRRKAAPKKAPSHRTGSESDSESSSESSSESDNDSSSSDSDTHKQKKKSPASKPIDRNSMGKSMPNRPSPSPTPARLAASLPSPREENAVASASPSSSSEEEEVEDAEDVLAWSEKMAEGDLAYFERLVGGDADVASPDLAALAKDVDLVSLDHFQ